MSRTPARASLAGQGLGRYALVFYLVWVSVKVDIRYNTFRELYPLKVGDTES